MLKMPTPEDGLEQHECVIVRHCSFEGIDRGVGTVASGGCIAARIFRGLPSSIRATAPLNFWLESSYGWQAINRSVCIIQVLLIWPLSLACQVARTGTHAQIY